MFQIHQILFRKIGRQIVPTDHIILLKVIQIYQDIKHRLFCNREFFHYCTNGSGHTVVRIQFQQVVHFLGHFLHGALFVFPLVQYLFNTDQQLLGIEPGHRLRQYRPIGYQTIHDGSGEDDPLCFQPDVTFLFGVQRRRIRSLFIFRGRHNSRVMELEKIDVVCLQAF